MFVCVCVCLFATGGWSEVCYCMEVAMVTACCVGGNYGTCLSVRVFVCRWALFPPSTPKEMVKVPPGEGESQRDEAVMWFHRVYPRTQSPSWPKEFSPVGHIFT